MYQKLGLFIIFYDFIKVNPGILFSEKFSIA